MTGPRILAAVLMSWLALTGLAAPALAHSMLDLDEGSGVQASPAPFLQCVPYARKVSGIQIRGDAWTWWDQAAGRYSRGYLPRVGAVMAFRPHGKMVLGHVAAVSRIIDTRTILLRHANWSLINGRRGQIEDNVRAVDVSPDNDWSEVRVWFAPIHGLGSTPWPVAGFIYGTRRGYAQFASGGAHGLRRVGAGSDPIGAIIATYLREDGAD